MTTRVTPLRYLLLVQRPSREILIAWLAVVAFGLWQQAGERDSGQVIALVLFVQMFGASAGYRDRLRRGHFDPILAGNRSRWSVAAADWLVAALPGYAVWWALVCAQWVLRPDVLPAPATAGAVAALLWTSTFSWAISVPTTRYAGGTLWTAGLLVLAGGRWIGELHALFEHAADGWLTAGRMALAGAACPFLLTSTTAPPGGRTLLLTAVGGVVVWVAGAAAVARFDAVLEDLRR